MPDAGKYRLKKQIIYIDMKKIYTLLLLLGSAFATAQAQVDFTFNGEVVQPGETLTFYAEDDGFYVQAETNVPDAPEPGLCVENTGNSDVAISVTVRKQDPADAELLWCGITQQCQPIPGRSETRSAVLKSGAKEAMRLDGQFTRGEYATYNVTTTVTANGESKSINILFVYSEISGIATPVANALAFANNTLSYSFDTQASRVLNVYNTAGALVKSVAVGQSGSVSLTGLTSGVYVATVTANGQKVATCKCLVR